MKTRQYTVTQKETGQIEKLYLIYNSFNMFEAKQQFREDMTEHLFKQEDGSYKDECSMEVEGFSDNEKTFQKDNKTFKLKTIRESEKWLNIFVSTT